MSTGTGNWELWDGMLKADAADLRAEAVLAELLLNSAIPSNSFIQWPNGGFGRAAGTDIERLSPPGAIAWADLKAVVELNRPGLYDLLPEGLFHQMQRSRPFIGAADVVDDIRHNNAIEEAARTFFLPIDHVLLDTRLHVELNERRLTAELLKDRTGTGVTGFWDPPKVFSGMELGKLLMLIPQFHRITGDTVAMAHAIGDVLDMPVCIEHRYVQDRRAPQQAPPALDDMHLGVDSVLHGLTTTVERLMVVKIRPLDPAKGDDLAPGQPGAIKLHKLMEYLAAADQLWDLEVEMPPSYGGSRLEGEGVSCRLGVSTILN